MLAALRAYPVVGLPYRTEQALITVSFFVPTCSQGGRGDQARLELLLRAALALAPYTRNPNDAAALSMHSRANCNYAGLVCSIRAEAVITLSTRTLRLG